MSAAELKVKKLSRLPANCACPNCGTFKKFGFSNICIKYHTFVCNNCKSSHQAISHRCKSLTMSSWSNEEADELMRKGNEFARNTWLQKAPPVGSGGRPREGDDINIFKRFIEQTYERRAYYGEPNTSPAAPSPAAPQRQQIYQQGTTARSSPRRQAQPVQHQQFQQPPARAPAPAPAPVPVADLLDFSAPAAPTPTVQPAQNVNSFMADFQAQQPPAAAPYTPQADPFSAPPPVAAAAPNAFAAPTPNLTSQSATSGFSFMNNGFPQAAAAPPAAPSAAAPPTNNFGDFAAFSGMAASSTATPPVATPVAAPESPAKKPVMRNMGMNAHSSAISMINDLAVNNAKSRNINIDPFATQGQQAAMKTVPAMPGMGGNNPMMAFQQQQQQPGGMNLQMQQFMHQFMQQQQQQAGAGVNPMMMPNINAMMGGMNMNMNMNMNTNNQFMQTQMPMGGNMGMQPSAAMNNNNSSSNTNAMSAFNGLGNTKNNNGGFP